MQLTRPLAGSADASQLDLMGRVLNPAVCQTKSLTRDLVANTGDTTNGRLLLSLVLTRRLLLALAG
jgi:hypothetical protein